jgi:hypothetical protein
MILQEYCRARNAREEELSEIRKKILLTELATAEIKKESAEMEKQNIKNAGERKKQLDLLSIQKESELLEAAIAENEIKQRQRDEEKKKLQGMYYFQT